jgi:hypothetical protein
VLTNQQIARKDRWPEIVIVERRDEYPSIVVRDFTRTNRDDLGRWDLPPDLDRLLAPCRRALLCLCKRRHNGDSRDRDDKSDTHY